MEYLCWATSCLTLLDSLLSGLVQQYWAGDPDAYDFVGVAQLAKAFHESGIGSRLDGDAPDLETGQKQRHHFTAQEEDSRQNGHMARQSGGTQEQMLDQQKKRDALDPLVHDKYGVTPPFVCIHMHYLLLCCLSAVSFHAGDLIKSAF